MSSVYIPQRREVYVTTYWVVILSADDDQEITEFDTEEEPLDYYFALIYRKKL